MARPATRADRVGGGHSVVLVGLLIVLIAMLVPTLALAHEVGLSYGEYRISGAIVDADLVFARDELARALGPDDGEAALEERRKQVQARIVDALAVSASSESCVGELRELSLVEEDGVRVHAEFHCPRPPTIARVELGCLELLSRGHRHIATLEHPDAPASTQVVYAARPSFELAGAGGEAQTPPRSSTWDLLVLGIEHILTGYDHLVFLLGLVLVAGSTRSIVFAVTAFTVAHSITLGVGTLGVWTPSPSWIEPLIALSIAYVGIENFIIEDLDRRWRITFAFGLIHGFGFAGALQEIALPRAQIPQALLSFNLGVELGQLAALALVLPLLHLLRRKSWFGERTTKVLNVVIVLAGLAWFGERILGLLAP